MRIAALLLTACFTLTAHAGPLDSVKPYPARKIAPDTWVITGPLGEPSVQNQGFMNNPGWIIAGPREEYEREARRRVFEPTRPKTYVCQPVY